MLCRKLSAIFALFAASTLMASAADRELIADVNLTAHLLAGNRIAGERRITHSKEWESHQKAMELAWSYYEKSTLDPMASWSRHEVTAKLGGGGVVRYPFSGPDILHALCMFPEAQSYVLCGLEPVGTAPRSDLLRGRGAGNALAEIRKILEESIRFSFFKTKDMKVELANASYSGTLPIICLSLARSGFAIEEIEYLELESNGALRRAAPGQRAASAVRIGTRSGRGQKKTIYYFRTNLADGEISKSGFLKFLQSLPAGGSYVKSASYLMHRSYFSQIRDHLLASSSVLVQDDSGIPLRLFDRSTWQLGFHGSYSAPISLFKDHYQADLRNSYRSGTKPLPFGTGYQWRRGDSNLLCAVRTRGRPAAPKNLTLRQASPSTPKPVRHLPDPGPASGEILSIQSTLDLTLKLVATSDLDVAKSLGKRSAFAVEEYEILDVSSGPQTCRGKRIRIASTSHLNGRALPRRPVGATVALRVRPLSSYPALMKWHLEDDLAEAAGSIIYIANQG